MKRWLLLLIFLSFATSCHYGMAAKHFPPAQGPKGALAQVTAEQRQFSGELIEVRDTGIVIDAAQQLRLLPYSAIASSHFENTNLEIKNRRTPEPDVRDHLRLVSRFPQGLSTDLLKQLLNANGQTDLAGVNP